MSDVIIPYRYLVRGGTAAAVAALNEIPKARELILETDTGLMKRGDGVTHYNDLDYLGVQDAADLPYDNTTSGLAASDVQAAIDEVAASGGGGGGGAMSLVATATVAGAAATTLTMTGLSLVADKCYLIVYSFKNATASNAMLSLYYNSDTTAANYWSQVIAATGSSTSAARANTARLDQMDASDTTTGVVTINRDGDGLARAINQSNTGDPAGIQYRIGAHVWTSATNVTSITISSAVASALAVGSFFKVFKIG